MLSVDNNPYVKRIEFVYPSCFQSFLSLGALFEYQSREIFLFGSSQNNYHKN